MNYEIVYVDMKMPDKLVHIVFDTETDEKAMAFANRLIMEKKWGGNKVELSYVHRRRAWGLLEPKCLTQYNRLIDI